MQEEKAYINPSFSKGIQIGIQLNKSQNHIVFTVKNVKEKGKD